MSSNMRILLIQARVPGDPMAAHELNAFVTRTGLSPDNFQILNTVTDPMNSQVLDTADIVMIGGSGDFSLVSSGFEWHTPFLEWMRELVRRGVPTFASCFGFQALVQALGGTLKHDENCAELGTHRVTLTDAGLDDPVFGQLPAQFDAQFGHNDSAAQLPPTLEHLASSQRCLYQAVRVRGTPIVATQFHPELDMHGNLDRFQNYLENYRGDAATYEEAWQRALALHRPSPHCSALLKHFLQVHGRDKKTVKVSV